jgi:hypothetical protein
MIEVKLIVTLRIETSIAIVTALNNMTGHSTHIHPWFAWHGKFLLPLEKKDPLL